MEENQQNQQENNNKVEKKFEVAMGKLMAVISGARDALKRPKVPADEVESIVSDLLSKRREKVVEEFQSKLLELLDKYVQFEGEVKKAEEELKNTTLKKKEEFTKQINECFKLIDNIDKVQQNYTSALKQGITKPESEDENTHAKQE